MPLTMEAGLKMRGSFAPEEMCNMTAGITALSILVQHWLFYKITIVERIIKNSFMKGIAGHTFCQSLFVFNYTNTR